MSSGPVQVRRHGRDEVRAILLRVGLAELDAANLGQGVGFVGRLEASGQQAILLHRLRRVLRINARAAEEKQLRHLAGVRPVDQVQFDLQILAQELNRVGGIGHDPADPRRRDEHVGRLVLLVKRPHRRRIAEIQLPAGAQQQVGETARLQQSHQRRAHHAAMTGDKDGVFRAHDRMFLPLICAARYSSSALTMIFTNSANVVLGCQPRIFFALEASPMSRSTSVGRK